jgi:hypothetical protein
VRRRRLPRPRSHRRRYRRVLRRRRRAAPRPDRSSGACRPPSRRRLNAPCRSAGATNRPSRVSRRSRGPGVVRTNPRGARGALRFGASTPHASARRRT